MPQFLAVLAAAVLKLLTPVVLGQQGKVTQAAMVLVQRHTALAAVAVLEVLV
jgi:hypothetical protein